MTQASYIKMVRKANHALEVTILALLALQAAIKLRREKHASEPEASLALLRRAARDADASSRRWQKVEPTLSANARSVLTMGDQRSVSTMLELAVTSASVLLDLEAQVAQVDAEGREAMAAWKGRLRN